MDDKIKALIKPNSETHRKLLEHFNARIRLSERHMKRFYARWQDSERRLQAYITMKDYERLRKTHEQLIKKGEGGFKAPKAQDVIVPYGYATTHTMATYLLHTFGGRKPIFQVGAYSGVATKPAQMMEKKLDYDSTMSRLVKHIWQVAMDSMSYGVGIYKIMFVKRAGYRTFTPEPTDAAMEADILGTVTRGRNKVSVFQGNDIETIDPFMFFPDPRVPMSEVNRRGEFVFWRQFVGKHTLKKGETNGMYAYIDDVQARTPNTTGDETDGTQSSRGMISGGEATAGRQTQWEEQKVDRYYQIDEGTVEIFPKDLGLEPASDTGYEKWLVTIANKNQIIRLEPFIADHDQHPVAVTEPDTMGYGFGSPSIMDMIGPLQDLMSWFMNSHVRSVNSSINNMFVVDPMMIEMQDLKDTGDGRIIRLKQSVFGQDVRAAINQLQVTDVTANHPNDMQIIMKIADAMTGVNDNVRGIQDSGGRKTATEVRTSAETGTSRQATRARIISAQAHMDLAEQMALNNMQFLDEDFAMKVMGEDWTPEANFLTQSGMMFHFPIHDGTLPLDKLAMLDVWKEIFMAVQSDKELRMGYDIMKIFQWIAELGGAQNIEQFRLDPATMMQRQMQLQATMMPDEQVDAEAGKGNIIPASQLGGPGVVQSPGRRAAGVM